MRYFGQINDVNVSLKDKMTEGHSQRRHSRRLSARFHEQHRQLFGWSDPNLPTLFAMLKLQAVGKRPPVKLVNSQPYPKTHRQR